MMRKSIGISVGIIAIVSGIVVGCGESDGPSANAALTDTGDSGILGQVEPIPPKFRLRTGLDGEVGLYCDNPNAATVYDSGEYNTSDTQVSSSKRDVSSPSVSDINRQNHTGQSSIRRFETITQARSSDGNVTVDGLMVHPLILSYRQQVKGNYELDDGSADIGDPTHVDGVFVGFSLDDGQTWKNYTISDTSDKSSLMVTWDGNKIPYPGNAQKPKVAIKGNYVMVAWHDKYCPSGNPLDLLKVEDVDVTDNNVSGITYPTDYFAVNGSQGYIDYGGIVAPNGKTVYQVPYSCVWTSRGILNTEIGEIEWQAPVQLTSGTRDSNHIWIEGSWAGFAMSWQEDTKGLRSGKGEGPGDGWSGATTNHGSDIWYSSLKWADFNATLPLDENTTKPKSAVNFHYPLRITDNEKCSNDDTKLYCKHLCDTYGYVDLETLNNAGKPITRCKTSYIDVLDNTQVVLNGDTGASRSALTILETDAEPHQFVVVFGYEETKGLTDKDAVDVNETDIALEGKSVYFESWDFDAVNDFNVTDPESIQHVAIPMVSSGQIVNIKVPDQNDSSNMIFENARRLVIGTQVDACDADKINFAFLYKQSFETRGDSSDMFVRVNSGFEYSAFTELDGRVVTNVSAQNPQADVNSTNYAVDWDISNLDAQTYDNMYENTFSPRIFLRGNDVFTGYAYTPSDVKTGQGHMPSNFHTNLFLDGAWKGPKNITLVTKSSETTEDPRFVPTPRGRYEKTGLVSDKSNPNTFFIVWGNLDLLEPTGTEHVATDIFYTRSTDKGETWDPVLKLAARDGGYIEEKEVQSLSSPDGRTVFNAWIQEDATYDSTDRFSGVDSWFGRMDYNITVVPTN